MGETRRSFCWRKKTSRAHFAGACLTRCKFRHFERHSLSRPVESVLFVRCPALSTLVHRCPSPESPVHCYSFFAHSPPGRHATHRRADGQWHAAHVVRLHVTAGRKFDRGEPRILSGAAASFIRRYFPAQPEAEGDQMNSNGLLRK